MMNDCQATSSVNSENPIPIVVTNGECGVAVAPPPAYEELPVTGAGSVLLGLAIGFVVGGTILAGIGRGRR